MNGFYESSGMDCKHCGRHIVEHDYGVIESVSSYPGWKCRAPDKPRAKAGRKKRKPEQQTPEPK